MADNRKLEIGEWTFEPARNRLDGKRGSVVLTPLAASVLEYLAQHQGQVISGDELTEKLWSRRLVGDSPVYRVIADLRHALGDDAHTPQYIETVRKRGYRLVAAVEADSTPDAPVGKPRVRTPLAIVVVAVVAAIVAFVSFRGPVPDAASVAVLPFADMSGNQSYEHVADGISEVLIHQLSDVPGLQVTARTSSFAFKDHNIDVREIGRLLNVAAILEGSVQRSEGEIRVTAQLIDTKTGKHYWSKQYDRKEEDIFAIQDEIAANVVAALRSALLDEVPVAEIMDGGTNSLAAYDEYLSGLQQLRTGTIESLPKAVDHFIRAIELDDDFVDARLKLAETYNAQLTIFQIDYAELITRNESVPQQILERDPNSARAMSYLALADFSRFFPTGSGEAERLWRQALQLAPHDPVILSTYAYFLGWNDRAEEAIELLDRALIVDPFSTQALISAARHGNLDYAERLREIYPDNPSGWSTAGGVHLVRGELAQAFEYFQMAERMSPSSYEFPATMAMILMTVGLYEDARDALDRAEVNGPGQPLPVASRIALEFRLNGLEDAGLMAMNELRNQSPPHEYNVLVLSQLALQYALHSGQPEKFIEAYSIWRGTPGVGGRIDFRDPQMITPTQFAHKLVVVPALRAAGEPVAADAILASAREYFENASETLQYHQTDFELALLEGDNETAVATLESLIHSGRGGFQPASAAALSELRWWLEFEGVLAEPLRDLPAYHDVLRKKEAEIERERKAILALLD